MTIGLGDTLLRIPNEVEHLVPCLQSPSLFTDPALDLDQDDESWVLLSTSQQHFQIAARQAAEERAVAACRTCPILDECREWAMEQGSGVFGVAGGLTYEQRTGGGRKALPAVNHAHRANLGNSSDDQIVRWSAAGVPDSTIAQWLECDVSTVEKRKEYLSATHTVDPFTEEARDTAPLSCDSNIDSTLSADPGLYAVAAGRAKAAMKAASSRLIPGRVSRETAALFDVLCAGGQRDRSEIVDSVLHVVDRQVALAKAPAGRNYADEDTKVRTGARKFLMNRLDIAVRTGRIIEVTTNNGRKLISMEPTSAAAWRDWRKVETRELVEV